MLDIASLLLSAATVNRLENRVSNNGQQCGSNGSFTQQGTGLANVETHFQREHVKSSKVPREIASNCIFTTLVVALFRKVDSIANFTKACALPWRWCKGKCIHQGAYIFLDGTKSNIQ